MSVHLKHDERMTKDEVETVMRYTQDCASRMIRGRMWEQVFLLAAVCGLRRCEIQKLNVGDVTLRQGEGAKSWIRVWGSKRVNENDYQDTIIPDGHTRDRMGIHQRWLNARSPEDPWIHGSIHPRRVCVESIGNYFKQAIKILPKRRQKELTTHKGRHTAGSALADAGVPITTVQKFMRHKSLQSTMRYLHSSGLDSDFELYTPQPTYRPDQKALHEIRRAAWATEDDTLDLTDQLCDIAASTPTECYVTPARKQAINTRLKRMGLAGELHNMKPVVYKEMAMLGIKGDHFVDAERHRAAVIFWRWVMMTFFGEDLVYERGKSDEARPFWIRNALARKEQDSAAAGIAMESRPGIGVH